jgi:hypothetical protein
MGDESADQGAQRSELRSGLIDEACSRFEKAWQTGQPPRIEDFLQTQSPGASGATLRNLLVQLVGIDLEWRWKTADAVEVAIIPASPHAESDTLTLRLLSDDMKEKAKVAQEVKKGFDGWLRFKPPGDGLRVKPGETMFIELEDTGTTMFGWKYSGNGYPGGERFVFGKSHPDEDWLFRVNP